MQSRRLLLAFIVAVIISGGFTLSLGKILSRKHTSNTSKLRYVAVTRSVDAGETLTPGDVSLVDWPGQTIAGAITRTEEAAGKSALYPLAPGAPLLDRQIASAAAGLSGRIPEGMRAISLKSNDVVGVAGYLLPGTHVDVLVTLRDPGTQDSVTSTVLQDSQVLTAGQKMQPDPDGKAEKVDVVTLLVTPVDAQKVTLASTQGTVQFVLRNSGDHAVTATDPFRFMRIPLPAATPPVSTKVAIVHKPGMAASHYTVQVRRGDKDSVETF
jgi:pilus assembly protein CpaB